MRTFPLLAAAALTGCSASMIIKQPVVDQCQGAGLRGCDQLTDGVLAYVDGDQEAGRAKLVAGAAQNNPEDVRKFAQMLTALRDLPGMSEQMGPIGEVAAILAGEDASTTGPGAVAPVGAKTSAGSDEEPAGGHRPGAAASVSERRLLAHTTSLDDDRRRHRAPRTRRR